MIVLKRVLVATDFSAPSDAALTYGRALARTFGASLHLLHVAENQFLRPMATDPATLTAAHIRWLDDRLTVEDRAELRGRAVVEISDSPAQAIVDYARGEAIDLIVMGTQGRSTLSQILVGSVAERVVRTAPCPVLTVRLPEHRFVAPDASAKEGSHDSLENILVATDFSAPSDAAIAYGRELAHSFGARLTVFHAAGNIAARGYGADGFVFTDLGVPHDYEAAAHRQIDAMTCGEHHGELKRNSVVVTSNQPASAIVEYAKQAGIDLIVMGTHGRGAVAHLLMGSVAERVVRTAPCPVLTIRHPGREFVLPDALVAGRESLHLVVT